MEKVKISLFVFAAVIVSMAISAPAFAEDSGLSVSAEQSVGIRQDSVRASATSSVKVQATTTDDRDDEDKNEDNDSATSTNKDKEDNEPENSESHRSVVSSFVQNLLKVADRERGIGAEVRVIAKEQDDSSTTTVEAMSKVEKRSSLKTLLLGSDYKNLGVIRSELAKTSNQIERLKALIAKVTNVADRVALEAEIKVLADSQLKTEAFVEAHESTFSFLGWFVKLFNK